MLTPERHRRILEMLKEKPHLTIQEITDSTGASESTIRRDLTFLEQEKHLKRVHGGAERLHGKLQEPSMEEKPFKNLQEKAQIARYGASLVEDGDCIYLDAGTTVREMTPFLPEKNVVVVTNGLMHIEPLLEKGIECYLVGGYVKQKTKALIGRGAIEGLGQYRFDKCFLGVNGIHLQYGYTTPDPDEALIKQTAMKMARDVFVLADSTKFTEVAFSKIAALREATIITNSLDKDIEKKYRDKTDIEVVKT